MTEIGLNEAKASLSNLFKRIENGEKFSITNRGKVIALMLPPDGIELENTHEAYSRLIELRTNCPVGSVKEVTDWKNEGRR